MKITPDQIAVLYGNFVDQEIAPKATTAVQRFFAYGSVYMVQKKVHDYLSAPERVESLKQSGIMTDDGQIDLDYLREMATFAMQKSGGKVQAMGLILDQGDIDKAYVMGQALAV